MQQTPVSLKHSYVFSKVKMISEELKKQVEQFQDATLKELAKFSVKELEELPVRREVNPEGSLNGQRFLIRRKPNEGGGFEISVLHLQEVSTELERQINLKLGHLVGEIKFGEGGSSKWFDVMPDGTILWPDYEYDPDD